MSLFLDTLLHDLRWYWRLEWRFSNRSISKQLEVYHNICLFTNFQFKGICIWRDISDWSFVSKANFAGKLSQQTAQIVIAVYENIPYSMRIWQFAISSFDCEIITSHIHSVTLCLVCLIHASLNGIAQVTFLLLDTIVFRRYQQTEMSLFVRRRSNVSFVTWHWNTSHCLELSNTTSSYWSSKSQSCPFQNTTSVHKYLWKLHFIIKSHGSFSIS